MVYEEGEEIFERAGDNDQRIYSGSEVGSIPLDRDASRINWADDDPDLTIAKIASCWGIFCAARIGRFIRRCFNSRPDIGYNINVVDAVYLFKRIETSDIVYRSIERCK